MSEKTETSSQPPSELSEKKPPETEADIYEDEPPETLSERLWGLTEMFPESLQNAFCRTASMSQRGIHILYYLTRSALWIVFSTSIILFAPVILEIERGQLDEIQRNQQKQILLGPNTAQSSPTPILPGLQR